MKHLSKKRTQSTAISKVHLIKGIAYKNGKKYSAWRHTEYDANGNILHEKDVDGSEMWHEYDANGNMIHEKDSDGFERWYDDKGKR